MARPRNERPKFVSINIQELCIIAEQLGDGWGEWSRKALEDMLHGCVAADVDPIVVECYNNAFDRMSLKQSQNKKAHESRKNASKSTSTEVAPVNASKRNDQLIWGRFENVFLSQDEYNTLATDFGNVNYLNNVIESLSASIADGKTISQNHFATLTRWIAWRKAQEEKEQSGERRATFKKVEAEREAEQLKRFGVIK